MDNEQILMELRAVHERMDRMQEEIDKLKPTVGLQQLTFPPVSLPYDKVDLVPLMVHGSCKNISAIDLASWGCNQQHAEDWLAVRKSKKKPLTMTALKRMQSEAKKAGITLAQAVEECASQGWLGFKASYMNNQADGKQAVRLALSPSNVHDTNW